ncbi:MAG: GAF domain-containing protein [Acidobacteria bacterium]|nr:GAF domain-containing protein [Acidobacteriota bacterium]
MLTSGGTPADSSLRAEREQFLSEFAKALAEGVDLTRILSWSAAEAGRLLAVDRVSLYLFGGPAEPGVLEIAACWAREGTPPHPGDSVSVESLPAEIRRHETLASRDAATDPRLLAGRSLLETWGTKSALLVPVSLGGRLRGVAGAATLREPRDFTADDQGFLQSAMRHLAAALKQGELLGQLGREKDRLRALFDLASAVNASRSVNEVLDAAMRGLAETLRFPVCGVALVSEDGSSLVPARQLGTRLPAPTVSLRADLSPLTARAFATGTPVIVEDAAKLPPGFARDLMVSMGVTEAGLFPLVGMVKPLGLLVVACTGPGRELEPDDVSTLQSLAGFVAVSLEQRRATEELARRTRILESIARATKLLNFRLNAPDVLQSVVEETCRAFPEAEGAVAYTAVEGLDSLLVAAAFGAGQATKDSHGGRPIPIENLQCAGRAFEENTTMVLDVSGLEELMQTDSLETRARVRATLGEGEIRQLMAAPVRVGDRKLGVIEVLATRAGVFSSRDAETLALLAEQAAIALRNARLIEDLSRLNRLKDDFLANLSHEVRTPLTSIVGWAEVLLDADGQETPPSSRRAVTAIVAQAEALSRMLTDLIDLSRIDNAGLELRVSQFSPVELVHEAVESVRPSATKKGVLLLVEAEGELPRLEADAGRLKQVLWNLLSNGIKFSKTGDTVQIVVKRTAGGLEIVVTDQGWGIDPQFLPLVFERFRQEETAASRRFGGLGVGLSIAQAIVRAHEGAIAVSSEGRGTGAVFRVTLPEARLVKVRKSSSGARPLLPVSRG